MTVFEKINKLVGREVEFTETTFKGRSGYLPIYINFNMQNNVSEVFDEDKSLSAGKFLKYLKDSKGDTDDFESGSE